MSAEARLFGERLTQVIRRKRLSAREASAAVGMTEQQMSSYANGRHLPRLDTLIRFQRGLGCTWSDLFGPDVTDGADSEPTCYFLPEECVTSFDRDGIEWLRYDPWSLGWSCSHCGRSLKGGDGGWFDTDTGEPLLDFCPYCGWRIDKRLTMRKVSERWRG